MESLTPVLLVSVWFTVAQGFVCLTDGDIAIDEDAPFFSLTALADGECEFEACWCRISAQPYFSWQFSVDLNSSDILQVNLTQPHSPREDLRFVSAGRRRYPPRPVEYSTLLFSIMPVVERTAVPSKINLNIGYSQAGDEGITITCKGISEIYFSGCQGRPSEGPTQTTTSVNLTRTIDTERRSPRILYNYETSFRRPPTPAAQGLTPPPVDPWVQHSDSDTPSPKLNEGVSDAGIAPREDGFKTATIVGVVLGSLLIAVLGLFAAYCVKSHRDLAKEKKRAKPTAV